MKNSILSIVISIVFSITMYAQELTPYIKIGTSDKSIEEVSKQVIEALESNSFTVLGDYHPAGKDDLKIIAFTNDKLKNTVVKVKDRGALAAVYKVGLVKADGKVTLSYTNPEYVLRAYLQNDFKKYPTTFKQFSADLKTAFSSLGNEFTPFGGTVDTDDLKKYHYKIMMPYFTDPVELNEFSSFEEGLKIIKTNLEANKGNTKLVYELVYQSEEVAVFGVGLESPEDGESEFLPTIGEAHAAALPYEIILQGTEVTMLHGKYRIALFWPDLTMGTFMKIMSTPGDIEDTLEELCE
ncbi:MAG: hypothetical protein PSN34_03425 [Urechidicola sp.]|nr:hypothetical protein [Urechidicola sp.]